MPTSSRDVLSAVATLHMTLTSAFVYVLIFSIHIMTLAGSSDRSNNVKSASELNLDWVVSCAASQRNCTCGHKALRTVVPPLGRWVQSQDRASSRADARGLLHHLGLLSVTRRLIPHTTPVPVRMVRWIPQSCKTCRALAACSSRSLFAHHRLQTSRATSSIRSCQSRTAAAHAAQNSRPRPQGASPATVCFIAQSARSTATLHMPLALAPVKNVPLRLSC
jgi:hypothetical protein